MENTRLLSDSKEDLIIAANLIKSGKIVGIPTETVYGLGADAVNPKAVKAVFEAKGRPVDNPLIVHICSMRTVKMLAHDVPELFYRLAERYWPGPLTMIVAKNKMVPYETSGGLDTVAIRMPAHPVMRRLIALTGPIAAPSANISGYPSPTTAKHVLNDLNGKIPAVIDGGSCSFGVESTVISFDDNNTVRILRPGSVTKKMLEAVSPNVIIDKAIINEIGEGQRVLSPGMKYKHYSPKANIVIVEGDIEDFCHFVSENNRIENYCLISDDDVKYDIPCKYLTYGKNNQQQAYNLFAKLRELDELGAATVFVRPPSSKEDEGLAVYNRLLRAAGFEVIHL